MRTLPADQRNFFATLMNGANRAHDSQRKYAYLDDYDRLKRSSRLVRIGDMTITTIVDQQQFYPTLKAVP